MRGLGSFAAGGRGVVKNARFPAEKNGGRFLFPALICLFAMAQMSAPSATRDTTKLSASKNPSVEDMLFFSDNPRGAGFDGVARPERRPYEFGRCHVCLLAPHGSHSLQLFL